MRCAKQPFGGSILDTRFMEGFLDSIRTKTPMRRRSKSETRPLQTKNNEFSISRNSFFAACLLLDNLFCDMWRYAHKNTNLPIFESFVIPFIQVAQSTQCGRVEKCRHLC